MNTTTQPTFNSRPTPRLQNSSKSAASSGWGLGFSSTNTSNGGSGFGSIGLGSGQGSSYFNGQGITGTTRSAQLSGFAQVTGGAAGSSNNSIDMSDFPSLSAGSAQSNQANAPSNWNGGAARAQQRGQTILSQRIPSAAASTPSNEQVVQSLPDQRNHGGGDEFPSLNSQGDPFASDTVRSPDSLPQANGLQYRDGHQQAGLSPQTSHSYANARRLSPSAKPLTSRAPGAGTKRYADMSEREKYGLEGLAAAYEARKALESGQPVDETLPALMRSGLFFGQDLNALGMDLDSPDPIWPTFTAFPAATSQAQGAGSGGGIFDYHDRAIVPDFFIPPAYTVTNVPPLAGRLGSLSDETLFCIFYQNPRDLLQEQAAQELTIRDWRWHKVLRQWLQKDSQHSANGNNGTGSGNNSLPILDLTNGAPVGVPPQPVSRGVERGVYVFFDVMNWRRERREFVLAYDELDSRFASVGLMSGAVPGNGAVGGTMGGPALSAGREGVMASAA